jgi:uncharacterized repeat protein (TIGR02543 family)
MTNEIRISSMTLYSEVIGSSQRNARTSVGTIGKVLAVIIALTVALLSVLPASSLSAVDTTYAAEQTYTIDVTCAIDYAKVFGVLAIVNSERVKEGLAPLKMSADLLDVAKIRAAEITIYFSHTRPDGTLSWVQYFGNRNLPAEASKPANAQESFHVSVHTSYVGMVSFDPQGGLAVLAKFVAHDPEGGAVTYGYLPVTERAGFVSEGWYTEPDGGTPITEVTVLTANATVYARWAPVKKPDVQNPAEQKTEERGPTSRSSTSKMVT